MGNRAGRELGLRLLGTGIGFVLLRPILLGVGAASPQPLEYGGRPGTQIVVGLGHHPHHGRPATSKSSTNLMFHVKPEGSEPTVAVRLGALRLMIGGTYVSRETKNPSASTPPRTTVACSESRSGVDTSPGSPSLV